MLVVSVVAGVGLVAVGPAHAQVPTPIDTCDTTITAPGAYVLTQDLTAGATSTCIAIQASDVVLDGAGHTMTGSGGGTVAVRSSGQSNVTVENLRITSWAAGIVLESSTGDGIRNVVVDGNYNGIQLSLTNETHLSNITATLNENAGLELAASTDNTITDLNTSWNFDWGLSLINSHRNVITDVRADYNYLGVHFERSDSNTLSNVTAGYNPRVGIYLSRDDDYNTLTNVTANGNGDGIYVHQNHDTTLSDVTANGNGPYGYGIWTNETVNFTLTDAVVNDNGFTGYRSGFSQHSTLTNITASNQFTGVHLFHVTDSTVSHITAMNNSDQGVEFSNGVNHTALADTVAVRNGIGVSIYDANDNTVRNTTATDNTDVGLAIRAGSTNTTARNTTASGNGLAGVTIEFSDANTLITTTATGNGAGLRIERSNGTVLTNSVIRDSVGDGITLSGSHDGTFTDTTSTDNGQDGIYLAQSTNNTLRDVVASGNGADGIGIDWRSTHNTVTDGRAANNGANGVLLVDSSWNTLSATLIANNTNGVRLTYAENNTITNDTIVANRESGLWLGSSVADNWIYNTLLNNTLNADFDVSFDDDANTWNVSKQTGPNVVGGPFLGGNYYATPSGTGYSQTCTATLDGFCATPYVVGPDANNTDFLPLRTTTVTFEPEIAVSPTNVDFGTVPVGSTNTSNVTVSNVGTAPLDVTSTAISGGTESDFSITDGGGPFVLGAGEDRNVTLEFLPASPGTKAASLDIVSNDTASPTVSVPLSGNADAAGDVSTCTVITSPGEYVLTQDIIDSTADTCIDIQSDDVVFHGDGHTIDGVTGGATEGVRVQGVTNVTVENLRVTDWGTGIDLQSSTDVTVRDVSADSNSNAISLFDSDGNTVSNVTATDSDHGIYAVAGNDDNVLTDILVSESYSDGVYLADSNNTSMSDITVMTVAAGAGIFVEGGHGDTIRLVTATDTVGPGIQASLADHISVADVLATNTTAGVVLFQSVYGTVTNVTAIDGDAGIALASSHNSTVSRSTSIGNQIFGVGMGEGATHNSITDTTVVGSNYGFYDSAGRENVLANNTVRDSVVAGVALYYSSDTVISEFALTNNSQGILLSNTSRNTFTRNSIRGGLQGIVLSGDNGDNLIFDNLLNNTVNVEFGPLATNSTNLWNVSKQTGPNIVGGSYLGGNYYATPSGTGYSQTCTPTLDGFCAAPFVVGPDANNTDYLPLVRTTATPEPDIAVAPTSVDFGTVTVGNATIENVTVTNDGTLPVGITDTSIGGVNESDFSILDGAAPFVLAPGESQNISLRFAPGSAGPKTATLAVVSNDSDTPTVSVSLTGTATGTDRPDISVKPPQLYFGRVFVDQDRTQGVMVLNTGKAALHVTSTAIIGPDADEFTIQDGAPFTLDPRENQRVRVTFAPTTLGSKNATLVISSNDPDMPTIEVELDGEAIEKKGKGNGGKP